MAHKFTHSLLVAALLAGTAAPAAAAPAPRDPEIQLLQPGDSKMGCEALAAEINQLASLEAKPAKKKKKGFGLGSLVKVMGTANPLLGAVTGNGLGGSLVNSAMGMAQSGAMQSQADAAMEGAMDAMAPAAPSVASQRKNRLMGFFEAKGC